MLSIVFITFRENCKFEWFIESLLHQTDAELRSQIQIIVVDGLLDVLDDSEPRKKYIRDTINFNFEFVHIPPKPTVWQGKSRVTNENYFAAANTRNTGACYAKYPYIAFHDDLGWPSHTWLNAVFMAKKFNKIQCGAYTKYHDMIVENGRLVSKRDSPNGVDSRLKHYKQEVSVCDAGHFFGSSFCMPLDIFMQINGLNEMCDGCGAEDYDFGIRLKRAGHTIYYNKRMFISESEEIFGSDKERKCLRRDPKTNANDPKSDLSHYLLNYSHNGPIRVNLDFFIQTYRDKILAGVPSDKVFNTPIDKVHFFTGRLISEGL